MGAIKSPLKTNNMNLESPHNNEQCVCSSPEQLENVSLRECAFMYKQFADDLNNINRYLKAAIKEAVEVTFKYRGALTASEVDELLQRYFRDNQAILKDLCSDVDDIIVKADQRKCPFCK